MAKDILVWDNKKFITKLFDKYEIVHKDNIYQLKTFKQTFLQFSAMNESEIFDNIKDFFTDKRTEFYDYYMKIFTRICSLQEAIRYFDNEVKSFKSCNSRNEIIKSFYKDNLNTCKRNIRSIRSSIRILKNHKKFLDKLFTRLYTKS